MHDIWNPWHGCRKYSEGCDHCYMYFLDRSRGADGAHIYRTAEWDYPLRRARDGSYRVKSGELIRVCMTSDFFLPEADAWREDAWDVIRERPDVRFFLLTKRAERIAECLPADWGDGYRNVMLNVTCENERRARERIPLLLSVPARHRGIMCAPLIGEITLGDCLGEGRIEQVIVGGENYDGCRPCDFSWVTRLYTECVRADVTFAFIETGRIFVKDGRTYHLPGKGLQSEMAYRSGMQHRGRPIRWELTDRMGIPLPPEALYVPHYRTACEHCGSRLICNGCSDCGKCGA